MDKNHVLTLEEDDPRVVAARNAEQQLFAFYGLEASTRFVSLASLRYSDSCHRDRFWKTCPDCSRQYW